ncbi:hypothetical protein TMatcc_003820 [Talaromyces marneffei ATCC 18224]
MHAMSSTTWVSGSTLPQVQSQCQSLGFFFFSPVVRRGWRFRMPPWYVVCMVRCLTLGVCLGSVIPADSLVASTHYGVRLSSSYSYSVATTVTTPDRLECRPCSVVDSRSSASAEGISPFALLLTDEVAGASYLSLPATELSDSLCIVTPTGKLVQYLLRIRTAYCRAPDSDQVQQP